jgi:hypothetical protein
MNLKRVGVVLGVFCSVAYAAGDNEGGAESVLLLAGVAGVLIFVLVVQSFRKRRHEAREYVLLTRGLVEATFKHALELAKHEDVAADTREELELEYEEFESVLELRKDQTGVDWVEEEENLNNFRDMLSAPKGFLEQLQQEVEAARLARTEAPKLLEGLPALLEATRGKLRRGIRSGEAWRYYKHAKRMLENAEGMVKAEKPNWRAVHEALIDAEHSLGRAETTYVLRNPEHPTSEGDDAAHERMLMNLASAPPIESVAPANESLPAAGTVH